MRILFYDYDNEFRVVKKFYLFGENMYYFAILDEWQIKKPRILIER